MKLSLIRQIMLILLSLPLLVYGSYAQQGLTKNQQTIDTSGFSDSAHHWYDIYDEDKLINSLPHRPKYKTNEIAFR